MVNINRLYDLLVILKERSGLYTCESVARYTHYLTVEECRYYRKEIKHLLDDFGIKMEEVR